MGLSYREIQGPPAEPSKPVAARVTRARARQRARALTTGGASLNAGLSREAVREAVRSTPELEALLQTAVDRMGLTARSLDRLLRVARTIADLADDEWVTAAHVAEALQFRLGGDAPGGD